MSRTDELCKLFLDYFDESAHHRNCFENEENAPVSATFLYRRVRNDGVNEQLITNAESEYVIGNHEIKFNSILMEKQSDIYIDWYAKRNAIKATAVELSLTITALTDLNILNRITISRVPAVLESVFDKAIDMIEFPSRLYMSIKNIAMIRELSNGTFRYATDEEKTYNKYFVGKYLSNLNVFAFPGFDPATFILDGPCDGFILNAHKPYIQPSVNGLTAFMGVGIGIVDNHAVVQINIDS